MLQMRQFLKHKIVVIYKEKLKKKIHELYVRINKC